jgi:hypothetical protein
MNGLRIARHRATTAQACVLYPGVAPQRDRSNSACLGAEAIGGGPFRFDPFDLYAAGTLTNPNVLVVGQPGTGKSASLKTMLHRWVGLHRADQPPRWVAVCDPKGEYAGLADALGLEVVRLHPGGTVRLNPLDPGGDEDEQLPLRRTGLLTALLATILRRELTPVEDAALGWAVDELPSPRGRQAPTLADVAGLLASPTSGMAGRAGMAADVLARSIEAARFGLGKLLDRDLRGMFDGPSTVRLDRAGPGLVLDLSAVHHDRDALALVMVAATAWIQARLAVKDGVQRIQVVDEAWALLGTPSAVRHLQASWKLCRDYGVANVAIAHRTSDLRAQADDGTAVAKVAAGLLADTETRVLFRQAPDQVAETRSLLGLSEAEADVLPHLGRGRALWKTGGSAAALVQHVVTAREWRFCDTDAALLGTHVVRPSGEARKGDESPPFGAGCAVSASSGDSSSVEPIEQGAHTE